MTAGRLCRKNEMNDHHHRDQGSRFQMNPIFRTVRVLEDIINTLRYKLLIVAVSWFV